jgi:transcriptional/translational regulatory protein YebC/TACO1
MKIYCIIVSLFLTVALPIAASADSGAITSFKSCEVGLKDHVLPVLDEALSAKEIAQNQYQAVKNMYNGTATAGAWLIVSSVPDNSSDLLESIRYRAENHTGLARTHWSVYSPNELLEVVMASCMKINAQQTDIIDQLRNMGFFDPSVTEESTVTIRGLLGVALEYK